MANGYKDTLFTRSRGVDQSDDSDIWDDTALIKAYDKAVASFKTALKGENDPHTSKKDHPQASKKDHPHTFKKDEPGKKRKNAKKNHSRKRSNASPDKEWQVGDACCAYWSEDGQLYTATVSSVDRQRGTCIVVFTDYGNEEEQNLQDLLEENSELEEETSYKANEVESSTEESDRSATPQTNSHQPRFKSKSKSTKGAPPPMLAPSFPGFPPGPPPMPGFKGGSGKRSGGTGPTPPAWPPMMPCGPPMIPPPPPFSPDMDGQDDEALGSMLISWYMSGYHTGYYLGLKQGRQEASGKKKSHHK